MERLVVLGFVFVFVGVLLIFLGILSSVSRGGVQGKSEVEAGGIVFIGPIPIVFGTSKGVTKAMLVLALVVSVLLLVFYLLSSRGTRPFPGT